MNQGSLSLSIRLRHPSMAPNVISAAMGVDPIAMHAAGEARRSPLGRGLSGQYAETYWAYKLVDRNDADLSEAIRSANDWMCHRTKFVADFTQAGGITEYYVSVAAKGRLATELSPSMLAQCAQFQVQLSIEVFHMSLS
jgi:hypothetical protein